jgi:hypothetical protein
MPRELRRLAAVAGLALAAVVVALGTSGVDGRRWEAARPTHLGSGGPVIAPAEPMGRRWA